MEQDSQQQQPRDYSAEALRAEAATLRRLRGSLEGLRQLLANMRSDVQRYANNCTAMAGAHFVGPVVCVGKAVRREIGRGDVMARCGLPGARFCGH